MTSLDSVPVVLTIAGSDSGGGAGIQADLKTFSAFRVYGTCAITAVTAQNTNNVVAIHEVPVDIIISQISTVLADINVNVIKTGMLSSNAIIESVTSYLADTQPKPLVVDPVMVSKSGHRLLMDDAVAALTKQLIPLATVVTPNIPEAEVLSNMKIQSINDSHEAAQRIISLGPKSVIIKGGHLEGPPIDLFYDGFTFQEFIAPRIKTMNTHGTGCTFASAIAANLARGEDIIKAIEKSKEYVTNAIRQTYQIGHGNGPLNHFYKWWTA